MTDPRPTMKHAMFDAFSEMNSLSKHDLTTGAGQRGARVTKKSTYRYSTNFMGPINYAWIKQHGKHWAGGRIDVHGGDEDYALSLPLMHAEDFSELSKWLGSLTTEYLWSLEEITSFFERKTSTKIRWFETPNREKDHDTI